MYVQGVSTRKVKAITEQLCGVEVSSSHISRATAQLDEVLEAWRKRCLGEYVYLYLDARYEKVRQDGQVRDAAVLIAAGVNWDGKRDTSEEIGVLFKTDGSLLQQAVTRIETLHPYDAPAVLGWHCDAAGTATEQWLGALARGDGEA